MEKTILRSLVLAVICVVTNGGRSSMREYICLTDCQKDGLTFFKGNTYKVDYNSVDGRLYIYTIWGYTDISKTILNEYFL